MMRGVLAAYGDERRSVWLADSSQGLLNTRPRSLSGRSGAVMYFEELAASAEEVRENRRYRPLDDQLQLVEGWFRDSLPPLSDLEHVEWTGVFWRKRG